MSCFTWTGLDRSLDESHDSVKALETVQLKNTGTIGPSTERTWPSAEDHMNQHQHLSPRQFADALGLAKPTVIQWLRKGWVTHSVLPNGRRLIPVSELERLLPKTDQANASEKEPSDA
jgi:hypothetical protein